ncbi:MAG: polyprenyl synthetase family protein, partial [Bacteroidaceae bacterium]|nr:polyprenyl synthetase family protein [Bacteroidaceae bacterium]
EGQQLDIEFENRDDVTADEYIEMIRLKTSVLLACALQLGAIQAGASEQDCDLIYEFGEKFGLAFQLQDDLLDVYGDAKTFGKNIGGDILCNKKTYMLINALALAEGEVADELRKWITLADFDPKEKIQAVTAIYDRLGIRQICLEKIHECYDMAKDAWLKMSFPLEKKQVLWDYVESMLYRTF